MYKLINEKFIKRIDDGATIPNDDKNHDWIDYQAWLALGNVPDPADPPPPPTQDEIDTAAAKQYAKLTALRAMTPTQVQAWVAANVTNLPQAQDAIATLAVAVSILARRL